MPIGQAAGRDRAKPGRETMPIQALQPWCRATVSLPANENILAGHGEKEAEIYGKRYVLRLPLTASNKAPPTPSNAHVAGSGTVTSASGEKRMLSREK